MKIFKIAITGSTGSGKSLVAKRFAKKGLIVLDCDKIARNIVQPKTKVLNKIIKVFNKKIIDKRGALKRLKIRKLIFDDYKKRKKVEKIMHPIILKEMFSQIKNANYKKKKKVVAIEVPLLFETGMEKYFDISIVVRSKKALLIKRIAKRDNISPEDARKMLETQMSQKKKIRKADYIIENSETKTIFFSFIDKVFDEIQEQFFC